MVRLPRCCILLIAAFSIYSCNSQPRPTTPSYKTTGSSTLHDTSIKTIHIYVALCDNTYQGIVPVPAKIGNGQDPGNNLYWGCAYGIKTYFKNSKDWKPVKFYKKDSVILERAVFKHIKSNYYLVADAYDGRRIKQATIDFLNSSSGNKNDTVHIDKKILGIGSHAKMISYIGHDGLMDFSLNQKFINKDSTKRNVAVLACYSKKYFSQHLTNANINPVLWSMGLMAPEAYIIHDAIAGYILNETNNSIKTRAAKAYSRFQKCSEKAARNLLVTGW
ncbi:hypothetical protein [Polluticaenibacter yanchengensis]|uniref:Uncharacterized protein n=1 Tax=Polluticaenibacter yanchengensis TaxID=3014562 RepID=A0ABT4UGH9_9BACT|nr:hypothetical protein [Chitinophagaceae bacterium LY-5]